MPRNMSFMLTTEQVRNKTKTVTRRLGWWFLKPRTLIRPVEKCQGLKKGEKVVWIFPDGSLIRIVSARGEPLHVIDENELILEGFPGWTPRQFTEMFCKHNKCKPNTIVNRIGFEYL